MYTPIKSLEIDSTYEQVFRIGAVFSAPTMISSSGQRFIKLTLEDITGTINGVVWNCSEGFQIGEYIKLKIKVTQRAGGFISFNSQFESLSRLADLPDNVHDYIPGLNEDVLLSYSKEIENAIQIEDSDYRNLLGNAIHKLDLIHALRSSPYGLTGPLSYRGGLLVHTVHSLRIAMTSLNQVQELEIPLNKSLIVAGCIFKNIGWHTTTLFHGGVFRERDAFRMVGIELASVRYIDHLCLTVEADLQIKINESKKQALEDCCSSKPLTIEGRIITLANATADLLHSSNLLLKNKKGNWAQNDVFIGHY